MTFNVIGFTGSLYNFLFWYCKFTHDQKVGLFSDIYIYTSLFICETAIYMSMIQEISQENHTLKGGGGCVCVKVLLNPPSLPILKILLTLITEFCLQN